MDANFKLVPDAVSAVGVDSKQAILEALAERFALAYGVDRDGVLESLEEREALGSTGFGRGVAIPHARTNSVKRPVAVVLKLESPVDFKSADGMPVDLVFGLLSPSNAGASHLHSLAAISRLMRDEIMHDALVTAENPAAIFAILSSTEDRDAA